MGDADEGRLRVGHDKSLLIDAARYVATTRRPFGASNVQRHIRVGFAKAGLLLLLLEQEGIISRAERAGQWNCVLPLGSALERIEEAASRG